MESQLINKMSEVPLLEQLVKELQTMNINLRDMSTGIRRIEVRLNEIKQAM